MTAVFVCSLKDIVCGEIPANWCDNCPRKHVMVPVAPHAAAGPYPTAMRQATVQEHEWLLAATRRASTLIPHPDTTRMDWLENFYSTSWHDQQWRDFMFKVATQGFRATIDAARKEPT